jgi:MFS family permease
MTATDLDSAEGRQSPWAPLRFPVFRALFIAQLASNIGTLMQSVGSAWLMGDLGASPFLIALVPTASMLPVLLVGIPGGALADIVDRRRLLIAGQVWMLLCAAALAVMSFLDVVTPFSLLALTFGLGLGGALTFPAFQAIQPELVPPREFRQAIALGSMTFNVGRAIGPAIGGFIVAIAGPGWVFLINAFSFLAIVGVLVWWQRPVAEDTMPAETLSGAVRAGLRYAAHSPALRGVLHRTAIFIVPAAALQALLPVVVRDRLGLGSGGYGVLLGCFGIGAASGAVVRPRLDDRFNHDELVFGSSVVMAGSLVVEGVTRMPWAAGVAMFVGGLAWATALTSTSVSSFSALPEWVRARGMGLYQLVLAGGVALGSAAWGLLAEKDVDRRPSHRRRDTRHRFDDEQTLDARQGVGTRPAPHPDGRPDRHDRPSSDRRPGARHVGLRSAQGRRAHLRRSDAPSRASSPSHRRISLGPVPRSGHTEPVHRNLRGRVVGRALCASIDARPSTPTTSSSTRCGVTWHPAQPPATTFPCTAPTA